MSHVMDGFSLSGDFTFASGTYYTPQYSGSESEAASGNTFIQRPDRVLSQPIAGAGQSHAMVQHRRLQRSGRNLWHLNARLHRRSRNCLH